LPERLDLHFEHLGPAPANMVLLDPVPQTVQKPFRSWSSSNRRFVSFFQSPSIRTAA
jgi:hypothetical protein